MSRPRLARALRITWTAFWGLAAALLICLWVRSYWRMDSLTQVGNDRVLRRIGTTSGILFFGFADYKTTPSTPFPAATNGWEYQEYDSYRPKLTASWQLNWAANDEGIVSFPVWALTSLFIGLAAAPLLPWRFSLRTLLIAITLIAVGLGIIIWLIR